MGLSLTRNFVSLRITRNKRPIPIKSSRSRFLIGSLVLIATRTAIKTSYRLPHFVSFLSSGRANRLGLQQRKSLRIRRGPKQRSHPICHRGCSRSQLRIIQASQARPKFRLRLLTVTRIYFRRTDTTISWTLLATRPATGTKKCSAMTRLRLKRLK